MERRIVAKKAMNALHQAGIDVSPNFSENMDMAAGFFMKRYKGKPKFEEFFFKVV